MQENQPEKSPNRFLIWLQGTFLSNVIGAFCLGTIFLVSSGFDWSLLGKAQDWTSGTLVASTFLTVPFGIGFVASLFWRRAELSSSGRFGWTMANLTCSLVGATMWLREGAICLIMASPLLGLLMWAGSACGALFWTRNRFLSASVLPILIIGLVVDAGLPHTFHNQVVTEFHSDQSPQRLWKYAANYPQNNVPPTWWLHRLGLPYPVKSAGETRVNGRRDVWFTGGVFAGEKIVRSVPNRLIEFQIDRQPEHPEVTNHFKMERGRIEFSPDSKGGTIMRATGEYELRVFPAWYFGYWTDATLHNLHWRVFEHMDSLARADTLKSNK